jgi:hypothetical protein
MVAEEGEREGRESDQDAECVQRDPGVVSRSEGGRYNAGARWQIQ